MIDLHHLKDNRVSYRQHMSFALLICLRMFVSAMFLLMHSFLPILRVPKPLSIGGMSNYLFDQDFVRRERALGLDLDGTQDS